jgi:hypothetical protein
MNTTELMMPEPIDAVELFTRNGIDVVISRIRGEIDGLIFDMMTAHGRKECASVAHKIARAKTTLDDAGKDLVSVWKKQSAVVDAERKRMRDTLDAMKDAIRKPLTDWENKEKARIETHEEYLQLLWDADKSAIPLSACAIQDRINLLEDNYARDYEEFQERADQSFKVSKLNLEKMLADALKREAEQAELERLRKSEQERQAKEREERIAREAAERARREEAEKTRKAEDAWLKAEQEKEALQAELARKAEQETKAKEAEAANAFKPLPEIKPVETVLFCEPLTSEPISKREVIHNDIEQYLCGAFNIGSLLASDIADHLVGGVVPHVTIRGL